MSHFYGTLNGSRGEATRQGTKNSGITVVAASWNGCIRVSMWHNEETGHDVFSVDQEPWHGAGDRHCLASGIVGRAIGKEAKP